ncbi:hypothetical protein AAVH_25964 [Aphelenchoides avenae]|nr:hypothetical protein AAVH_25964 [Aphelenchus avenae]
MFSTTKRAVDTVRQVLLLHVRYGDVSTLGHSIEPLTRSRRTDVPTPYGTFIREWLRQEEGSSTTDSTAAELFEFENAKMKKKLTVFAWTIEETKNGAPASLHCAFLLEVADK